MNTGTVPSRHWLLLLFAVPVLLPFSRSAEAPILVMIGALLVWGLGGRLPPQRAWPAWIGLLFLALWLPAALSLPAAQVPSETLRTTLSLLRLAPLMVFAWLVLRAPGQSERLERWMAWLLLAWCVDAWVQALSGWSLGGPWEADRLSGIFGADKLKLGPVLVLFSPFLLRWAERRGPRGLGHGLLLLLAVPVLLAGTRSAWIGFALVSAVFLWRWHAQGSIRRGLRMLAAAGLVVSLLAAGLYPLSSDYRERVDRSMAALLADGDGLDHALAGRLPIWSTALAMWRAHPWTGVGVRGFRQVYAEHAAEDDPWIGFDGEHGAFHAHQIVLELLSETGLIGLACWLLAAGWLLQRWRRAAPEARERAFPALLALAVMVFPLNTHYAFYSSFWSLCLAWLLGVAAASLMPERASGGG